MQLAIGSRQKLALFAPCFILVSCFTYTSALQMDVIRSSVTSVDFYQLHGDTTQNVVVLTTGITACSISRSVKTGKTEIVITTDQNATPLSPPRLSRCSVRGILFFSWVKMGRDNILRVDRLSVSRTRLRAKSAWLWTISTYFDIRDGKPPLYGDVWWVQKIATF
jgi:hypothetical protein